MQSVRDASSGPVAPAQPLPSLRADAAGEVAVNKAVQLATEASQARLALAQALAGRCPPHLACEIAVTGSAARGIADDTSDVEINVWGDEVAEARDWCAWLVGAGATEVSFKFVGEPDTTTFRWVVCRIEDIWVELGFSLVSDFNAFVADLVAGRFIDHLRLQMGWTIHQAVPLRTDGRLDAWKLMAAGYPEGLAERIVANQTAVWSDPHVPGVRWALAARSERLALALRFTWDMQNLLRVVFAINRVWDRDLKWTNERALDLPLKPRGLSARIDAAFTLTDLERSVETVQRLIIETLELARDEGFEVGAALESMRAGLQEGLRGSSR